LHTKKRLQKFKLGAKIGVQHELFNINTVLPGGAFLFPIALQAKVTGVKQSKKIALPD